MSKLAGIQVHMHVSTIKNDLQWKWVTSTSISLCFLKTLFLVIVYKLHLMLYCDCYFCVLLFVLK